MSESTKSYFIFLALIVAMYGAYLWFSYRADTAFSQLDDGYDHAEWEKSMRRTRLLVWLISAASLCLMAFWFVVVGHFAIKFW